MRKIGAIFDVDGVLVDSPHERAWRESLQQLMAGPWRDQVSAGSYAPDRYTTEVYQAHVAGKPRGDGARAALAYFGIADPGGALARRYGEVKQARLLELIELGNFLAFDDGLRIVLRLKDAGVPLAAASSSKNANLFLAKVQVGVFCMRHGLHYPFVHAATTLLELFDANVCGRDFAHGKPHPEIFLTAAAELGLAPEQCVVIEDAGSGVQAAKAGGMAGIGIARLGDQELLAAAGADRVVTSLDDISVADLAGLPAGQAASVGGEPSPGIFLARTNTSSEE